MNAGTRKGNGAPAPAATRAAVDGGGQRGCPHGLRIAPAGLTYAEIPTHLGRSPPWAYRLVQRPIAAASPKALGVALAQCDVLLHRLAGSDLDTLLRLNAKLRTLAQRA
jgi:hypothetical protein